MVDKLKGYLTYGFVGMAVITIICAMVFSGSVIAEFVKYAFITEYSMNFKFTLAMFISLIFSGIWCIVLGAASGEFDD